MGLAPARCPLRARSTARAPRSPRGGPGACQACGESTAPSSRHGPRRPRPPAAGPAGGAARAPATKGEPRQQSRRLRRLRSRATRSAGRSSQPACSQRVAGRAARSKARPPGGPASPCGPRRAWSRGRAPKWSISPHPPCMRASCTRASGRTPGVPAGRGRPRRPPRRAPRGSPRPPGPVSRSTLPAARRRGWRRRTSVRRSGQCAPASRSN
mmetsp:Transcript_16579/g.42806  ORF Transcript_16579/g.42806 Transcript_16579/m.42806 type:complete len:212 (-) Transcript_16579:128-763(-)